MHVISLRSLAWTVRRSKHQLMQLLHGQRSYLNELCQRLQALCKRNLVSAASSAKLSAVRPQHPRRHDHPGPALLASDRAPWHLLVLPEPC
eukprot:5844374-Pleurochrysis_carterae.AAC.2